MKKILLLTSLLCLFSCKKEQNLEKVNETIYVRHQGADMPVYMRGNVSSKVIMLVVHGGPGGNGLEYRTGPWTIELESNYGVAYWDQRGQGMSQGQYDRSRVTVAQMAADMDAVIQVLKHKYGNDVSIFAFGHSWGGTLTAKFMTTGNLQHSVKGWIESNGAHDLPKNDIESVKLFRKVANEQITLGNSADKWQGIKTWADGIDTNAITNAISGEINSKAFEVEEWLMADGILNARATGGNSGAGIFSPINPLSSQLNGSLTNLALSNELLTTTLTSQLNKVTIPVLVLTGKYDFVVAPALSDDTFNLVSSTSKKLVVFEKSGHSPMSHEPVKYTSELIQFMRANK